MNRSLKDSLRRLAASADATTSLPAATIKPTLYGSTLAAAATRTAQAASELIRFEEARNQKLLVRAQAGLDPPPPSQFAVRRADAEGTLAVVTTLEDPAKYLLREVCRSDEEKAAWKMGAALPG